MDRQQRLKNYYFLQSKHELNEYVFMTRAGYRHFFVLGKTLKEAEENFMRIDEIERNGFDLNELPIRLQYDKEKCKDWSMDKFWENNFI